MSKMHISNGDGMAFCGATHRAYRKQYDAAIKRGASSYEASQAVVVREIDMGEETAGISALREGLVLTRGCAHHNMCARCVSIYKTR